MKNRIRILAALLVIAALALPAGAFTADRLDIAIEENGTATITFDYTLSWIEDVAVFFRIADPADELKSALETFSGRSVDVVSVSDRSATFSVESFVHIAEKGNETIYTTPSINLTQSEEALKDYWFAPLIDADFSPAVTVITFPDGSQQVYENIAEIPKTSKSL
ncbi:hypothetical protein [Methanofollis fontis]|uniref:Uncharacterized protein n=1 Tax=Methanofollis fontis TaxID=2052832 RepID=A0A483CWD0_9EURY|nr:hypothetical protein [Methanofollis fontis]TAJ43936.1 hypothetical protein CUJ86_07720 [Methanofollis fontis]